MAIENMRIDDFKEICRIWSGTNGLTLRAVDDSREGIERFLKRNPKNNFVCRINDRIVGGILCGHDGRKGFIYHAAVKKDYRNQGIGQKLVERAITSLKEERITKIGVLVNTDNISGNHFWESLGFEHLDDLTYRILPLDELNT